MHDRDAGTKRLLIQFRNLNFQKFLFFQVCHEVIARLGVSDQATVQTYYWMSVDPNGLWRSTTFTDVVKSSTFSSASSADCLSLVHRLLPTPSLILSFARCRLPVDTELLKPWFQPYLATVLWHIPWCPVCLFGTANYEILARPVASPPRPPPPPFRVPTAAWHNSTAISAHETVLPLSPYQMMQPAPGSFLRLGR